MPVRNLRLLVLPALAGLLLTFGSPAVEAQEAKLGSVDFPTSGAPEAQAHFLRGVAALHSFWYEEALAEFREATRIEPEFAMGHWGEAMAHNHPLWAEQDTEAARKVLAKIRETPNLTARERAYIAAVRALYGEGDKLARDFAYSAAMEKIYRQYPEDLEAAAFYALSLLGTVRPDDKGFRRQMQAAAIAFDVFQKNPNHPGAAHYIIHACDDPEHAILALPAARRYAAIAPEAHHARHMPSHIFLQLGMWPEAAASNESAWAASAGWVERRKLSPNLRDFHSLHWLAYIYLQQGRQAKAEELLALLPKSRSFGSSRPNGYYADMAAALVIETDSWQRASEFFDSPESYPAGDSAGSHRHTSGAHANAAALPSYVQVVAAFVRGIAAARVGSVEMEKSIEALGVYLRAYKDAGDLHRSKIAEIMQLEIAGMGRASAKKFEDSFAIMKLATAREEEMSPPSGPSEVLKPSHELFGEILMMAGRHREAAEQFQVALERQPGRALSLLGVARAAARSGDRPAAVAAYSSLLQIWEQADPQIPELREAREYVNRERTRAGAANPTR